MYVFFISFAMYSLYVPYVECGFAAQHIFAYVHFELHNSKKFHISYLYKKIPVMQFYCLKVIWLDRFLFVCSIQMTHRNMNRNRVKPTLNLSCLGN